MPLEPIEFDLAAKLSKFLHQQQEAGKNWVVYSLDTAFTGTWDLQCFKSEFDALHYEHDNTVIFDMLNTVSMKEMLFMLKEAAGIKIGDFINGELIPPKEINMNLNNLENLKEEMKALGFKDKLITEMEKSMEKNVIDFKLYDSLPATKGQVDLTLYFKQSGQSDFYYFNKFEATLNTSKPLEEGQKYLVISPGEKDKPVFRKFENPQEAIAYFREQKGNSELAVGKDPAHKEMLAQMENGKINYVKKEFQRTFHTPPVSQMFWIERGKGFTAEQASNLIQGRSVYRDDLLNIGGIPYKAWVKLDFDNPKDRNQNYKTNQYHDPSYGFDLQKTLDKYNIKELADPAKRELLESSIRSGNRPLITTIKDGQETKLFIEAVPRYNQVNLFAENGKPEKREQFLKEPAVTNSISNGKSKEKDLSESQGLRR